jgi:hypothetical protein
VDDVEEERKEGEEAGDETLSLFFRDRKLNTPPPPPTPFEVLSVAEVLPNNLDNVDWG